MGRQVDDITTIYDDLKREQFPQMTDEEAEKWISSQQRAARMCGAPGQIRKTTSGRMVVLVESAYDVGENGVRTYRSDWWAEDVLTGRWVRVNMSRWEEETYSAMEALAWAAQR